MQFKLSDQVNDVHEAAKAVQLLMRKEKISIKPARTLEDYVEVLQAAQKLLTPVDLDQPPSKNAQAQIGNLKHDIDILKAEIARRKNSVYVQH